jgi:hypothetical protein
VRTGIISTTTKLVGVSFGEAQENIRRFWREEIESFELVREPDNADDPNAIKVVLGDCYLGYLPRRLASRLAPAMDAGRKYEAIFSRQNRSPHHDLVGLTVRVQVVPTMQREPELAFDISRKGENM